MDKLTCEHAMAFVGDSKVGMALADPDGSFIWVNDAYCKILNAPRELIVGKTFGEFTQADDLKLDLEFADRLKRGEASSYEFAKRYIQRGSTPTKRHEIWGLLTAWAIWNGSEFIGYRVTFEVDQEQQAKQILTWQNFKNAWSWSTTNWRSILTVLAIASAVTGIGGNRLLEMLHRAKEANSHVESVLEQSPSAPSFPQP